MPAARVDLRAEMPNLPRRRIRVLRRGSGMSAALVGVSKSTPEVFAEMPNLLARRIRAFRVVRGITADSSRRSLSASSACSRLA